ncbi:MAG: TVP38/TMEM64 family protein [Chromatiales bacterium]|nr:TVP38/TMEM64 family protein [Chromatiales bacterium]
MSSGTTTDFSRVSRRLPLLIIGVAIAALLAYSEEIHQQVVRTIDLAEPVIRSLPILGTVIFVLLAALSAILVFFSGLLLVPIGIEVWGPTGCFLLLWGGWFLGGVMTYSIGRHFGRPVVLRMLSAEKMARYENRIPPASSFVAATLTQLALPSDISGYFFGLLGYRARVYLGSLALAELPYAFGTVFLGNAFVERQYVLLIAAAMLGILVLAVLWARSR